MYKIEYQLVLRNLDQCVTHDFLLQAYHALVLSYLAYAVRAWGHTADCYRVFGMQRKAVRIVAGLSYREYCKNAFSQLKILTFPSLYIFENLPYNKKNLDSYNGYTEIHFFPKGSSACAPTWHRSLQAYCTYTPVY